MSRVLLVCPEPLGHGQPAGIGIRFLEMAKVLLADSHSVTMLSADGGAVPGCAAAAVSPQSLLQTSEASDVAVVQGHVANELFAHARPIPTVVDLYDPFIVENLHYYATRGAEVFTHDHATLMQSLLRGDLFLCASEAQRLFYLGMLLAAGRLNPIAFENDRHFDQLLRIAPFGVQPPRSRAAAQGPHVLFGGIYDWYDPILAIDAVAAARAAVPDITLTFTRHPNPELTPQGKTAEAIEYVQRKGYGDFVKFEPWFAYDARGEFFERFAIALLTFPQSLETDLSMRTRIYDYLWGGLPIVTSSAPGTDELLQTYSCGLVVRPESSAQNDGARDAQRYAVAIRQALGYRHSLAAGTSAFVAGHQWPQTLAPLREFCRAPRVDPHKDEFAVKLQVPEHPRSFLDRLKRRIGGTP